MKVIYCTLNIMLWVIFAAGDPQVATMKKTFYEDSGIRNENTFIAESADNLIFKDPTTGQKTLAELAAMNDGITTDSADARYQRHYTRVLYVAASGGNYTTIQAAVNAADAGTSTAPTLILIAPGYYAERVTVNNKNIHLKGMGPREAVTIEITDVQAALAFGEGTVNLNPGANRVIVLENLTIRNAGTGDAAAAVMCGDSTASGNEFIKIFNCHIYSGCRDALPIWRTNTTVRDSRIENAPGNAHTVWGAYDETIATFENCTIYTEDPHAVAQLANSGTYTFIKNFYEDNDVISPGTTTLIRIGETNGAGETLATTFSGAVTFDAAAYFNSTFAVYGSSGAAVFFVNLNYGDTDPTVAVYDGDTDKVFTIEKDNTMRLYDIDGLAPVVEFDATGNADFDGVVTSTQTNTDNTRLDGNRLSATDTDGDLELAANGTGNVNIATGALEMNGTTALDASRNAALGTITGGVTTIDTLQSDTTATFRKFAADAVGHVTNYYKSRHATPGSHTILQSGDVVEQTNFYGSNGTAFELAAQLEVQIGGTPGASADMPGKFVLKVSPDGSATPAAALTINADGSLASVGTMTATKSTDGAFNGFAVSNTNAGTSALAAFRMDGSGGGGGFAVYGGGYTGVADRQDSMFWTVDAALDGGAGILSTDKIRFQNVSGTDAVRIAKSGLILVPISASPTGEHGLMYYDSDVSHAYVYTGAAYVQMDNASVDVFKVEQVSTTETVMLQVATLWRTATAANSEAWAEFHVEPGVENKFVIRPAIKNEIGFLESLVIVAEVDGVKRKFKPTAQQMSLVGNASTVTTANGREARIPYAGGVMLTFTPPAKTGDTIALRAVGRMENKTRVAVTAADEFKF